MFFGVLVPGLAQAQVVLQGSVRDAETGVTLTAAHLVVEATGQGTITNQEGRFEMVVPALPVELRVRHIGYNTQRLTVEPNDPRQLEILLEPAVYELEELFVTGDDFAANVMRKVIEHKQNWRRQLHTTEARGYTRLRLENEGAIKLLAESVFDSYWDSQRGPREVVRSRRETADFYRRLGRHAAGYVANLYDDVIDIQGLRFIGPTHPDALDHYTFSLAERRALDGQVVYDIYFAPKTGLEATFVGRVSVLDSVYAMLEADVRPARHVVFPESIEAWDVFYRQQFVPVADTFWLPVDLRLEGRIHVDPGALGYPPATLYQVSRFSGYTANEPLPDAPYAQDDRLIVDSLSVFKDDLFLLGRNILPLTPRETVALERLRFAGMTLERAFPPQSRKGLFAAFEARRYEVDGPQFVWPEIYGYEPWLRYNRVDGYFSGVGKVLPFSANRAVELRIGQASGYRRIRFLGRGMYRWGRGGSAEIGYTRDTTPRNASPLFPVALNSLPARLDQGDHFDYYWREGGWLKGGYAFPLFRLAAEARVEEHESVERQQEQPWPFSTTFRSNPPVDEGRLHTLALSLALGDGYQPFRTGALRRAEVHIEHSDSAVLGGDFDFTRYQFSLDGHVETLFRNRPRPNALMLRVLGGTSSGTLPAQRLGVVEGRLGPLSTFGALRSLGERPYEGNRYLGVFWEHDFKTIPFEGLGLDALVDRNMGVRLFGGHARSWLDDDRVTDLAFTPKVPQHVHHELGLSLTNIGGSPFRLDFTYRLDEPGFFIGFGLSQLF